jgi:peroxiredoxin
LAEYRGRYEQIRAAGGDLVAVSVDEPKRSEALRRKLGLPFPILCDTRRAVVRAWGVYNPKEKRGIAEPAVFVIGRGRRVLFRSLDEHVARVPAEAIVEFLRGGRRAEQATPRRRKNWPSLRDFLRALRNTLRFGTRSRAG